MRRLCADPTAEVRWARRTVEETRARVRELTGVELCGLRILDIGPGRHLRRLHCLAPGNRVVGIDSQVIPRGTRLRDYARMFRQGPALRALESLFGKVSGRDARVDEALARELGVPALEPARVLCMKPTAMTFLASAFGFVCSYSVFQDLDDPEAALREVCRVLRPGGVAYLSVRLDSPSSSGAGVAPRSLAQWKALFERIMPGTHHLVEPPDRLPARRLVSIWQKPEELLRAATPPAA
jgi:SAM-dependent methyltransferase